VGRFKDALIEDMNVHQVQELVDKHKGNNDLGYVKFLEEQLKKAEDKIENMHKVIGKKKNPGYCVECFTSIKMNEIICSKCQDERDGRWDHLRE
jgi:uncharacterized protein YpuA (DUF1002 family)